MMKMHQTIKSDQRGIALAIEIAIVLVVLALIYFIVWRVYQSYGNQLDNTNNSTQNEYEKTYQFNKEITLTTKDTAVLKNGNETIKLRFTELSPPENPNAKCDELCFEMLPRIYLELEYAGKTYKGTATSKVTPSVDMSFEENGAYVLIPYNIEIIRSDLPKNATVKVTKKEFIKAELGKPFTLKDEGVAALEYGKTGVHISFGICGMDKPCIREVDYYVDDTYVDVPLGFADPKASPDMQFYSKDGSFIDYNGLRLRLIESDDTSFATFVFEKL